LQELAKQTLESALVADQDEHAVCVAASCLSQCRHRPTSLLDQIRKGKTDAIADMAYNQKVAESADPSGDPGVPGPPQPER
jgi:hypothetical protein